MLMIILFGAHQNTKLEWPIFQTADTPTFR